MLVEPIMDWLLLFKKDMSLALDSCFVARHSVKRVDMEICEHLVILQKVAATGNGSAAVLAWVAFVMVMLKYEEQHEMKSASHGGRWC
jgi:hypothetical protein